MIHSAFRFPDLIAATVETSGMAPTEAATARQISHLAHARWLTLEHLLARCLRKHPRRLEPKLRGLLITAAAQLVFMPRMPVYAVIDQSVDLAKRRVRPGAASVTNATLRRLADACRADAPSDPATTPGDTTDDPAQWRPQRDALPDPSGAPIVLKDAWLPHPDNHVAHLAAACSVPEPLVLGWIERHGLDTAKRLALHAVLDPPTFVWAPQTPNARRWQPGEGPVSAWVTEHPLRRVQDPTSAAALSVLDGIFQDVAEPPKHILDLCAGRGTKTRQLRRRFAPHTTAITAADPDDARREDLATWADRVENVHVRSPRQAIDEAPATGYPIVLLDVPCSNTGVLGRRPEARYRHGRESLESVIALQREIIADAMSVVAADGYIVYATCSIEPSENEEQAAWAMQNFGLRRIAERATLPSGRPGDDYHDGGYATLLTRSPRMS